MVPRNQENRDEIFTPGRVVPAVWRSRWKMHTERIGKSAG